MAGLTRSCAVLALAITAQPAKAEWGATHWGMTVREVVAAVGGDARKVRDRRDDRVLDHRLLAKSSHTEDGIAYTAEYFFGSDGRGLTMVRLVPVSTADCGAMQAAQEARFGRGSDRSQGAIGSPLRIQATYWLTGPGEQRVDTSTALVQQQPMLCHVLYQQRDFYSN